jgi:serine/threonine-protein kinase
MNRSRTDKIASDELPSTPEDAEFEAWLRKAAHAPVRPLPARLPALGQVIGGKYRIEAELGTGGMGAVFRATHIVSDKAVALKWLLRPASDEHAVRRFTREARAAGRIDHPNVVDVYDIGQDGDASYLVMELLHGESLRRRLARGLLPPVEAVALLLPAMNGVAAAHREGVIHRDLKPDNIFLCRAPNGEPRPAKVLDFGVSMISSPDLALQTALTSEGALLGTPAYMAPEQLISATPADARTDVYAFGVILYETLTGRLPFQANSYLGLALAIANTDPTEPRELRPELSEALQSVVLQALHKLPAARPQTMEAWMEALVPFTAPSAPAPPLAGARAARPRSARPGGHAKARRLGATVCALALAAALWFWFRSQQQPRAALPPDTLQPKAAPARAAPAAGPTPATAPTLQSASPLAPAAPLGAPDPALHAKPPAPRARKRRVAAGAQPAPHATPAPAPRNRVGAIRTDEL